MNNPTKTEKLNVLIVDDDALCIQIAEHSLKKHFNVSAVNSGFAAVEIIEKKHFDIILMDINLNNVFMDGIKTTQLIRLNKKHKHLLIYAFTVHVNSKKWYLDLGFDGLYIKPISEQEFILEIESKIKAGKIKSLQIIA